MLGQVKLFSSAFKCIVEQVIANVVQEMTHKGQWHD